MCQNARASRRGLQAGARGRHTPPPTHIRSEDQLEQYAVLIYDSEREISALSEERMAELIGRHEVVQEKLAAENKLGPVVRLMPTTSARTLKQGTDTMIVDGPFAETKEQLLGFYVVDCPTSAEAMEAARLIGTACGARTLEVRPVQLYYANAR